MNVVSLAVWTLEQHCYLVYAALGACFLALSVYHRGPVVLRTGRERRQESGLGGEPAPRRDSDSDSDPDLTPALPLAPHVRYSPPRRSDEELIQRSGEFHELMARRRTVRAFSAEEIPREVLENVVRTAGTAPSGAHTEPWTFVVVRDASTKAAIRDIVEEEEELNYSQRMSRQWVADLKPFATRHIKPYLTEAPALLLVFRQTHSFREDGKKKMHYYSEISVAIAAGFILAAIQYCGLVALTSTPLNCNSRIRALLRRPPSERLELLLPVGRPHPEAMVPDLHRKPLQDIMVMI
ncbi:hypothetical protein JYU34_004797 [Plutella xylostella]|uniref:Nitroreductase domain-containing protein n=1 Tax=Plutella xylostella TaxID=51655 RepID=A0ABQ7QYW3_PLUXY|nr:hypothetical protein JYU34_004797 [Plutella xylostella]